MAASDFSRAGSDIVVARIGASVSFFPLVITRWFETRYRKHDEGLGIVRAEPNGKMRYNNNVDEVDENT